MISCLERLCATPTASRAARRRRAGFCLLSGLALFGMASAADPRITIDDSSFKCIREMKAVRHFYVDNTLGNVDETVAVAQKGSGDYPVGSVLQLVPTEVMVKQPKGFNAATRDWEFFAIDVSEKGSKIYKRGFAEVNNRFGGNCFACHVKAKTEFDFVCEKDHGCDPVPFTREMFGALQRTDPRCKNNATVSAEDAKALQQLGELVMALQNAKKN